jgi:hypothetical protein
MLFCVCRALKTTLKSEAENTAVASREVPAVLTRPRRLLIAELAVFPEVLDTAVEPAVPPELVTVDVFEEFVGIVVNEVV